MSRLVAVVIEIYLPTDETEKLVSIFKIASGLIESWFAYNPKCVSCATIQLVDQVLRKLSEPGNTAIYPPEHYHHLKKKKKKCDKKLSNNNNSNNKIIIIR